MTVKLGKAFLIIWVITMENIRNRINIHLAKEDMQIVQWFAKPNFKIKTIFT